MKLLSVRTPPLTYLPRLFTSPKSLTYFTVVCIFTRYSLLTWVRFHFHQIIHYLVRRRMPPRLLVTRTYKVAHLIFWQTDFWSVSEIPLTPVRILTKRRWDPEDPSGTSFPWLARVPIGHTWSPVWPPDSIESLTSHGTTGPGTSSSF